MARVRAELAGEHAEQGGLPGTVLPQQAVDDARVQGNGEVGPAQRVHAAEALVDVPQFQQAAGGEILPHPMGVELFTSLFVMSLTGTPSSAGSGRFCLVIRS